MKLTSVQHNAVQCDQHVMLTACPGSGKTRVIISKLARVIDDVRDTPRSVACITYTNTAVHEIEARLRHHIQPGDDAYFDICTIHSFCLNYIFRPFCHLVEGYREGFKVLTPESEEFEQHVKTVLAAHRRPSPTLREIEEFGQLRVSLDGQPIGYAIEHGGLTADIALDFWKEIRKCGFVDFANIIYHSLCLLRNNSEILSYIAAKFTWILVDEFQDTTDLQVEILSLISGIKQTRLFLVGDPHQSIFGFAGSRPDLAAELAARIKARTDHILSENFRSSPPIINHANLLFPRCPPMVAEGPAKHFLKTPEWIHGTTAFEVITDHFLPAIDSLAIPMGEAAILAPTWYSLYPLGNKLREYGTPIVGPGARPYKRSRHFAPLAEQICGYMMEPRPEAISGIERTLFNTILDITGRAHFNIFSYAGRACVFKMIHQAQILHAACPGATIWLEAAAKSFTEILMEEEYFGSTEQDTFALSVVEMHADMLKNRVDFSKFSIEDLGIYSSPESSLKLSTIHNAKGREYLAVAIIDLHEGKLPSYRAKSESDLEEAKRLFYVGITRAKRILLYVTDSSSSRNIGSRFLQEDGLEIFST